MRIGKADRGYGVADADDVLAAVLVAPDVEQIETWSPGVLGG